MSHKPWTTVPHVRVADQWVALASRDDLVNAARLDCETASLHGRVRSRLVFDSNGQGISLAQTDPQFRSDLELADVVHADGQFIVKVSDILSAAAIPERASTTDMIHDFARMSASQGYSFYLLGGSEEVNARCAEELINLYPSLKIAGRANGYFRGDEDRIIRDIKRAAPDFLWVGLGKPYEQRFCVQHRSELNAVWTITCGGCFNFVTGNYSRAPLWMQKYSLEWLYRAIREPKRLGMRYLTTTPRALITALTKTNKKMKCMEFY